VHGFFIYLFSSAFLNAYFERVADGKFKTAKKVWRGAVTAYYEFPSLNFLCETERATQPGGYLASGPTGILEYYIRILNPASRH
jgi:hypothetical protein